ncbi:YveK family protein [Ornithinibacillus californiensis]|uniref:YveK family protein n=1 Tax=Ornithinibacillus californiensis TaxID=161536 RepID=UPI00064DE9F0|nr:Wzz/FepE/Etk N-terminal domain-containing protein [Ornithinibacillus californiensis]
MNYDYQQKQTHEKRVREINLKEYFEVIKRRFWIVLLITFITTIAGFLYSYFASSNFTPLYQTSTRMIIEPGTNDMSTLMVMIKDPIIMERVKEDLSLTRSSDSISNQITVTRIDNSHVVSISVVDSNPELAAAIANTTAVAFKEEIVNILGFRNVQLLSDARVNMEPINSSGGKRTIIIAFIFGVVTGLGLIFLLDSLDEKVRREQEVEKILGVPVLGVVSNMNKKKYTLKKQKKKELTVRSETADVK